MNYKILFFELLLVVSQIDCTRKTPETLIKGTVINPAANVIKIGDKSVAITANGKLSFYPEIKSPAFFEVSYADVYWVMYVEPGTKTEFTLTADDSISVVYEGDLKSANDYLLGSIKINYEINDFLNNNWVSVQSMNESGYISVIDSLKRLFLVTLSSIPREEISAEFVKLFTADVRFGFNRLIVQYPENHRMYTGEKVILSREVQDYIDSAPYDDRGMMDLSNYKSFCRSWIDFKAETEADKNTVQENYNLKKMDAVFHVIPEMFHDQYLSDHWLSDYLYEFIFLNGLTNSVSYVRDFNSICKTKEFTGRIDKCIRDEQERRKDHLVKVYKTIDGLSLEAHIFSPDSLAESEKRPAIVLFHGGGWEGGNPSWMFESARHFRNLGMVAIAAQYRLGNHRDVTVLECLDDARDMIKWMRINSDSLHIDPNHLAAYGWSAGGHLAVSAAIFKNSAPGGMDSSPDALILFSPAVSLPTNRSWIISALGYGGDRGSINPVDHIRKGLPPAIILQGRDDTVTPLDAAQLFTDRMHKAGNYCELVVYDSVGHLFTPNTMPDYNEPSPDPEILGKATGKADEFLVKLGYIRK